MRALRLSDPQARRLWRELANELRDGSSLVFETLEKAVRHLAGKSAIRAGGPGRPDATRRRRPPA